MPYDEPLFENGSAAELQREPVDPELRSQIRELFHAETFAVLCSQGQGQPYGSVVGFATGEDLSYAVFATPVTTRKYRLITECDRVALVVDNRGRHPDDMMKVEAVTATGRVREVTEPGELEEYRALLMARHPYFRVFLASPTAAIFRIDFTRFLHVIRFQDVRQWVPRSDS
jgi:nitroimidazol reductase NimA-like FMN-containing flavoprotein (pyridoxamine 5'-phosphate oxidase superfamily)